ncbi:AraC-type DNA-binding protein [Evansella caseinilytica]|uniref:AraC-type DNA-binding protein n=1 Tax=Evansella caseinilytica TaxID=1503961 RepID=A0A1H3UN12_9BACI|nr:AraC family transcriptional regulator [Evansella caseinilytica]SDZ63215.1 AraC-type DNA-binding protein [Evansella caseinilytica]
MSQIMVYVAKNIKYSDLTLHNYGYEQCWPSHYYGPAIREYYLIHYILSGKGIFKTEEATYKLKKGQGFFICPGHVTYYEADVDDPWEYYWVGFYGHQAEAFVKEINLSVKAPIFTYENDNRLQQLFQQLISIETTDTPGEMRIHGLLYLILSELVCSDGRKQTPEKRVNKEVYVNKVTDFIEMNYAHQITVTQIADYVGLDRSYLGSLFKSSTNTSIQEYLINYRISKACSLLYNSDLSIGNISRSVGYEDPLLFSKIFKKYKGVSPKKFRNQLTT